MNIRTFTLGAFLLLAASGLGLAGERVRGNIVEHQGKLYVLQPTDAASFTAAGTFALGMDQEVFHEMLSGAKAHKALWDKVEAIYELSGTPAEMAALKDLELRWIDVEGKADVTSEELDRDPMKRKVKSLAIEDLRNPSLRTTRQRLRRTWSWEASTSTVTSSSTSTVTSSTTWTWNEDLTFGGAKLMGPGRAELESYMPSFLTPFMGMTTTQPAVMSGTLLGPQVLISGYVHMAASGRYVVALMPLESIADVSGGPTTTPVSAPGAGLPLPKAGGGLPTTVVVKPAKGPVVKGPIVSGPGSTAVLLTKTIPATTVALPGATKPLQ
ncbi:MAG: hypothetical protein JKY65_32145, partial [Planctomycetes bacterium]|nr:hypothetical protein [Planctomycetota bacterium]